MNVYKASAFTDRVAYASNVIAQGGPRSDSRVFDTCFEMGDGTYVSAALVRRVLKNPASNLAKHLFTVLNKDRAMESYEKTKHLSRTALRREAMQVAVDGAMAIGYQNL